jgi:hypothetical protein
MESLGYVLLYFLRGSLPWQSLEADSSSSSSSKQKERLVLEKKQSAEAHGQVFKDLPGEFKRYFEHIRSLRFHEMPNYAYLRRLFRNLFHRNGFEYDSVFDWTELKFLEELNGRNNLG